MTNKLILIDGSSLLSTSFFGNVPKNYYQTGDTTGIMKTADGRFTNGVYTMSKVLLNVIKKQKPTHLAVAWDINRNTFRRELYPAYKGQRKDTKPELKSQFALMQEVLDAMNIAQFKLDNYEADDIIGTFAKRFEDEIPVYIMTKDQDALQLITEKTKVWLNTSKSSDLFEARGLNAQSVNVPLGSFEFTPQSFEEEYGIKPIQIIDMKALEGDSSDNIPGVKGVGPAAVIPLLQEYGTIEEIYDAIETTPLSELKLFFKDDLGISRSPIAHLIKKTNIEIAVEIQDLLANEFSKLVSKDIVDLFKLMDDKAIKEESKALAKMDEELFRKSVLDLSERVKLIDSGIVGKEAAFLSKELATIKTDIDTYIDLNLNALCLHFNEEDAKRKFVELGFKSLMDKI